jgi:hypothetical protein
VICFDDCGDDDICRAAVIEFSRIFGRHEIEVTTALKLRPVSP